MCNYYRLTILFQVVISIQKAIANLTLCDRLIYEIICTENIVSLLFEMTITIELLSLFKVLLRVILKRSRFSKTYHCN